MQVPADISVVWQSRSRAGSLPQGGAPQSHCGSEPARDGALKRGAKSLICTLRMTVAH
ncbi:hypothetical protein BN844_5288 [Pseudomonas sp. SHC52]|nr:hypothetical protein BN844_5288 [Pseudomonas sp. SHC52]